MRRIIVIIASLLILGIVGVSAYTAGMRAKEPELPTPREEISADETDNEVFAKYYPRHYDSYQKNYDMSQGPSVYGGSQEKNNLEVYPYMTTLWKGYGFSKEYLEDRGHVYAIEDVKKNKTQSTESCVLDMQIYTSTPGNKRTR